MFWGLLISQYLFQHATDDKPSKKHSATMRRLINNGLHDGSIITERRFYVTIDDTHTTHSLKAQVTNKYK